MPSKLRNPLEEQLQTTNNLLRSLVAQFNPKDVTSPGTEIAATVDKRALDRERGKEAWKTLTGGFKRIVDELSSIKGILKRSSIILRGVAKAAAGIGMLILGIGAVKRAIMNAFGIKTEAQKWEDRMMGRDPDAPLEGGLQLGGLGAGILLIAAAFAKLKPLILGLTMGFGKIVGLIGTAGAAGGLIGALALGISAISAFAGGLWVGAKLNAKLTDMLGGQTLGGRAADVLIGEKPPEIDYTKLKSMTPEQLQTLKDDLSSWKEKQGSFMTRSWDTPWSQGGREAKLSRVGQDLAMIDKYLAKGGSEMATMTPATLPTTEITIPEQDTENGVYRALTRFFNDYVAGAGAPSPQSQVHGYQEGK